MSLNIGLLILRLGSGGFMLVHGIPKAQKILGPGIHQFADPLGVGAEATLIFAAFAEALCAITLIIGLKTRFSAIAPAITMFVAAFMIHGSDPFKIKEKALLYLTMYIVLIFTGGGSISVDNFFFKKKITSF